MPNINAPRICAFGVALLATASIASAQQGPIGDSGQAAPLRLAPISTTIVFAPETKITTVNETTAVLTGGYVGKLVEEKLLVGAGAYWLAAPRDDARMFYGGLVLGARILGGDRVNLSAHGLAGVGSATVYRTVDPKEERHHIKSSSRPGLSPFRAGFENPFLLVEPEARLAVGITDRIRLNAGAGYQATTGGSGFQELIRGATGSFGVEFDLGK